jgi:hypothetical protein
MERKLISVTTVDLTFLVQEIGNTDEHAVLIVFSYKRRKPEERVCSSEINCLCFC